MASTYVQISRDELEDWLSSLGPFLHKKWMRAPNRAGVYLLPLSDTVAIKLSSTIGTSDDAMGRGQASMQLSLVSLSTGQTLNKKAQGQSHFARTLNWQKNWKDGLARMKEAYQKSAGFYDALATIENRDEYKADLLGKIESVANWRNHNILSDFHTSLTRGSILTLKQESLLQSLVEREREAEAAQPNPSVSPAGEDPMIPVLRDMYVEARKDNDGWLMDFTKSVADQLKRGRPLSEKQQVIIDKNRAKYRLASVVAERFLSSL